MRQQQWLFVGVETAAIGRSAAERTARNDAGNGERAALNVTLHLAGGRTSLGAEASTNQGRERQKQISKWPTFACVGFVWFRTKVHRCC